MANPISVTNRPKFQMARREIEQTQIAGDGELASDGQLAEIRSVDEQGLDSGFGLPEWSADEGCKAVETVGHSADVGKAIQKGDCFQNDEPGLFLNFPASGLGGGFIAIA